MLIILQYIICLLDIQDGPGQGALERFNCSLIGQIVSFLIIESQLVGHSLSSSGLLDPKF